GPRQQRDRPEHHRRGPGGAEHDRGGDQHQELGRRVVSHGAGLAEAGVAVQVLIRAARRPGGREANMRALVIDDSRSGRSILGKILREMGMDVVEDGNGVEALEQLKRSPDVELILVDWNMPEMNGLEFIQVVRSRRGYDGVRILMVTTETESSQVVRAL